MKHQADVRPDRGNPRVAPGPKLPTTIVQLGSDGSVHSSTSEVFGRSPDELNGRRLQDLLTPATARRLDHALRAASEGGVFRLTVRGVRERSPQRLLVTRTTDGPATYSVIVSPTAPRELSVISAPVAAPSSRRALLVAEDEPMLLQLSCRVLAQAGFETTPVVDGKAVLETLTHRADIGLIVLDLSLPGPSTPDLLRLIRALEDPPRILLVTGRPLEEIEAVLAGESMPEYLQKPYPNELLIDTVNRLLDS
jgi:CheY-like chemotaxis protein